VGRIREGDTHCNDVHQLLQHLSFAFERFGRWIDRSQSSHSEAVDFSMFAFLWIGIGELRQEQRVGGSPDSFNSLSFWIW